MNERSKQADKFTFKSTFKFNDMVRIRRQYWRKALDVATGSSLRARYKRYSSESRILILYPVICSPPILPPTTSLPHE
jgi:hypothetical protein